MVCLSIQCGAVVAYDFQLQGALTDLGGNWQCQTKQLHWAFHPSPVKQTQHRSPDTQAQRDFQKDSDDPIGQEAGRKSAIGEKLMKLKERSSLLIGLG